MDPYLYCLVRPRASILSLSACMIVCMKPPAVWLYVCLYPALTSLNSVVTAWSPGAPADREARDCGLAPATRHLPQIIRSFPRAVLRVCVRADRRGGRRSARLIRAVCVHHHTPPPPPRRPCPAPPDTLVPDRRACGVGPSGGGNPPHAADVSRRAPSHASARPDRPDMYACQLVRALRRGFLWAGAGGPCRLRLAPEGRTWHPSIHNFALSGKSSQSNVSTCSGRARAAAPPGHSWPFCVTPFLCNSLFRRNANMYSKGTHRVQSDRRVGPASLPSSCGSNA